MPHFLEGAAEISNKILEGVNATRTQHAGQSGTEGLRDQTEEEQQRKSHAGGGWRFGHGLSRIAMCGHSVRRTSGASSSHISGRDEGPTALHPDLSA